MDYSDLGLGPAAMLVNTKGTFLFIKKWELDSVSRCLLCCMLGNMKREVG
jgi:hypothetical protein